MMERSAVLSRAAVVLALFGLAAACGGEEDPEQLLREAREAHEVQILSMTQHEGQVIISLRIVE
mgnify:CR=1 FL=1